MKIGFMFFWMLLISAPSFCQDVPIFWMNYVNVNHDPGAHSIKKNVNSSNWDAWGISKNIFDQQEPAILKYKCDPVTGNSNLIIAIGTQKSTYNYSEVDYGFLVTSGEIIWIHNGIDIGNYSRTSGGELLELKRTETSPGSGSWIMTYYIDGIYVASAACSGDPFRAYGLISQKKMTIEGLAAEIIVEENVTHFGCYPPSEGAIDLTISGGIPGYDITWSTNVSTEDISGLPMSTYTVIIEDQAGNIVTASYDIIHSIIWANEVNVTTTPSSIIKTTGSSSGASGAVSLNSVGMGQIGYFDFQTTASQYDRMIGYSNTNTSPSVTTIEHGIFFSGSTFEVVDMGTTVYTGSYIDTDVFRIQKSTAANFRFYQNGVLIPVSVSGTAAQTYVIDVYTIKPSFGFHNISASFCNYAPILPNDTVYIEVKDKLDGGFFKAQNNKVRFIYRGEYNNQPSAYNIINNSGSIIANENSGLITNDKTGSITHLKEGDGYYSINITSFSPGFYILELTNTKGEKAYLRFKV